MASVRRVIAFLIAKGKKVNFHFISSPLSLTLTRSLLLERLMRENNVNGKKAK